MVSVGGIGSISSVSGISVSLSGVSLNGGVSDGSLSSLSR